MSPDAPSCGSNTRLQAFSSLYHPNIARGGTFPSPFPHSWPHSPRTRHLRAQEGCRILRARQPDGAAARTKAPTVRKASQVAPHPA